MALGIGKGGELNVVLRVKDDGSATVRKFGDDAEAGFGKAERGAERTNRAMGGLQRTLVTAVTTLISFAAARNFVDAFKQQEQAVAALDASIASMGRTTAGLSAQLQSLASEIQREGIIGDEALIKGQSFLTTYGQITDDMLPRTTRVMADLAAKMGGDTVQAANLLGKASMGMVGELSRIGITLSEATKESKDFEAIIAEIEAQVGGMNAALGRTATGGIQQFSNAWGDVQERLGQVLATAISPFLREIAQNIEITDQTARIWTDNLIAGIGASGRVVAHLGNAFIGLKEIFLVVQIAFDELNLKVLEGLSLMAEASINVKTIFRDISEQEQRALLQNQATIESARAGIAELKLQLSELAHGQLPTDQWDEFMGRIIDSVAEFRANAAAVVSNGSGGNGEGAGGMLSQVILGDVDRDLEKLRTSLAEKLTALDESYYTEQEMLFNQYAEKQLLLQDALDAEVITYEGYYERLAKVEEDFGKRSTKQQETDAERNARLWRSGWEGKWKVMSQITGEMEGLMLSSSETMFNIGKAFAITNTIIDTYVAAQRAYSAMAGIPIVGPALAAAAAASAIAVGLARVQAIRSQTVGGGGSLSGGGGGAVGTYPANPNTGLPATETTARTDGEQEAATAAPRIVNIVIDSDRMITTNWVRDELIPEINNAVGDGVVLRVSA